ncbi:class I SAM-dependent methyltransferase [Qipengyuania spongiae]|uniref:Methyltransferase n=1 Tax=Qipengyuania spongiae TaxID=2909673 RepID=A0ABY5SYJ6_9SPHN|nr:methyltransferase [Qipengyuania spongiae]UVI39612.1 methyltransferase [Qipengyuania spongiae]
MRFHPTFFAGIAIALAAPAIAQDHSGSEQGEHHRESADHVADQDAFMREHGEQLSAALNHPSRAEDRARDQFRHPQETLAFFHVGPHMKVGEYAPGGGWYTRVLGHYLGGEGELVGLYYDPTSGPFNEQTQANIRKGAAGFAAEAADFTGLPADNFSGFTLESPPEDQLGTFDRILVVRMMHNLMRWNIADSELKTMRTLLKPGGMLGIVQHRAPADASAEYADGSKGYLRQDDAVGFVEALGFELVGASEVNANPRDPANWEGGVWMMPPSLGGDDAMDARTRDLGESDRMTLLFRKR